LKASNRVIIHCTLVQHAISHGKDPKDSNADCRLDFTSRVYAHSEHLKVGMAIDQLIIEPGTTLGGFTVSALQSSSTLSAGNE
jgi:hypothetical protein